MIDARRHIVIVLLFVAIAFVQIVGGIALKTEKAFVGTEVFEVKTVSTRERIAELKDLLDVAEMSERDYFITGKARHLESYRLAVQRVPSTLERLRTVLADNAQQEGRLKALEPFVGRWINGLKTAIAQHDQNDIAAAIEAERSAIGGPSALSEIKRILAEMDAHEHRELIAQSVAAKSSAQRMGDRLWISLIGTVAIGIVSLILLRRSATEHQKAFDIIRDQAALLDKTGEAISVRGLDRRLLYHNRAYANFYGEREPSGAPPLAGAHAETADAWQAAGATAADRGEWSGEIVHRSRSGSPMVVFSHWTLIRDKAGLPVSFVIVDTDVTEKKAIEARFFRAQRLESLGLLAAGVAHDLNNVLAPLAMGIPLLEGKLAGTSEHHILAIMEASVQRGKAVVRQILGFSQGSGERRGPVQISHVVRDMMDVVRETFPKSIRLELERPGNVPLVSADANQIYQVLMNLCVNARDAMPRGGVLTLTVSKAEISASHARRHPGAGAGTYVRIAVRDTGEGIAPEIREKIFEPFFTTKAQGQGTGLGLPTVIAIARNHGGFVEVESELGQGSLFAFFLPALADDVVEHTAGQQTELPRGNGELILIADDEASVRELTKALLEASGYNVLTACDGAEAVAVFAGQRAAIRLVITDIAMPIMDGHATIAALRRLEPNIRIVGMSGSSGETDESRRDQLRTYVLLAKPVSKFELLRTVHEALNH